MRSIMRLALGLPVVAFAFLACSSLSVAQNPPGDAVALHTVSLDEDTLRVHFIDIGGGLAVLIETPGGKHMLIDGGKKGTDDYETYIDHFVDYQNEPIDYLVVTHADDDHFHNMTTIIEYFNVGEYWNTGYTSKKLMKLKRWPKFVNETLPALIAAGAEDWSPIGDFVQAGELETIDDNGTADEDDDVVIQYLNVDQQPPSVDPDSGRSFSESQQRNNASLVIKVIFGNTSFLFTGDINGREMGDSNSNAIDSEEKELLDRHNQNEDVFSLKATVLQVAHHGSDGSNSAPFLAAVDPEWAVVPAGNAHGHPTKPAMTRLKAAVNPDSHILRTDESGSESFASNGNDNTSDPTGDDNLVFVVDEDGIDKILRIKVE